MQEINNGFVDAYCGVYVDNIKSLVKFLTNKLFSCLQLSNKLDAVNRQTPIPTLSGFGINPAEMHPF